MAHDPVSGISVESAAAVALQASQGDGDAPTRLAPLVRVYRHPLPVRIWHWTNALAFVILLLSGLQILNYHPRFYIGDTGYAGMPAVLEFGNNLDPAAPHSWVRVGSVEIPTTLVLGHAEKVEPAGFTAFPWWLRLPWQYHLGLGRGWHFLMAWVLVLNLSAYFAYLIFSKRLYRTLLPRRRQLTGKSILADLWMHLRFKHPTGLLSLQYNLLQKLSYLIVLLVLLPTIVLTGMTMSNSAVAAFPWLIDLFQGRQTARLIHFICAVLLTGFLLIHIAQVFIAGFIREMRSIVTGYYEIPEEEAA